jgi:hypothetical protein
MPTSQRPFGGKVDDDVVDLAVPDGLRTWRHPCGGLLRVADDLVAGLPHVLPAVLEVEDPNQGLIAEELGGLVDEVGSRIGDPHQLLALQHALHGCRGVELPPEPVAVVERGAVGFVNEIWPPCDAEIWPPCRDLMSSVSSSLRPL